MLSYMLPVDEKPPPVPMKGHLQLELGGGGPGNGHGIMHHHHHNSNHQTADLMMANGNGRTAISKDSSFSSFASDATTATVSHSSMTPTSTSDKPKTKLLVNGGKHQSLKRVSFGSSKGSMVETLIFESPLQEEPEPSPIAENSCPFPEDLDQTEAERSKVRVTFFQQSKPQSVPEVDFPDEPIDVIDPAFMMATATVTLNETNHISYTRQESTESGWDNPFRPGGDLSREADEIVELIKGGKPITPTPGDSQPPPSLGDAVDASNHPNNVNSTPITHSPKKVSNLTSTPNSANGNAKNDKAASPGALEVQRGTVVPAGDASQVEHIVLKKKPKCKCCVIQ